MKRGRSGIVLVLVLSLAASGIMRAQTSGWQQRLPRNGGGGLAGTIGTMNNFALALVLGGLRGPLVMFLWATSESQKSDRDLEDFDTKVEWIRRLQPEFATVQIFQIWNKAYNISVMLASPADRYVAVMKSLDYADSVFQELPGDINVLAAVSQVYTNKLDGPAVQERPFYNRQFREETMTDAARKLAWPDDAAFHRLWASSLALDQNNNLLPALTAPDPGQQRARPASATEWNDGSAFQYLKKYQPFPYGIPPLAAGFNYSKRAQVALRTEGQKPLSLSAMVIDSRPALELKEWSEEEYQRGRILEARAFNLDPSAPQDMASDIAQSNIALAAQPSDAQALHGAIYAYTLAVQLEHDARVEYDRHLASPEFVSRFRQYESHLDDLQMQTLMATADLAYLQTRDTTRSDTRDLLRAASENYRAALVLAQRIVLKYYVDDAAMHATYPSGAGKEAVKRFTDAQVAEIYPRAMDAISKLKASQNEDNRVPYQRVMARAALRVRLLSGSPLRLPS